MAHRDESLKRRRQPLLNVLPHNLHNNVYDVCGHYLAFSEFILCRVILLLGARATIKMKNRNFGWNYTPNIESCYPSQ